MMSTMRRLRASVRRPLNRGFVRALTAAAVFAGLPLASTAPASAAVSAQCGGASWYALDGRRTASGEIMNSSRLTAAHRWLPMGSLVTLKNRRNGRVVTVRINDRGPFVGGRIIDVSRAAAQRLGFIGAGVASVCMSRGTAYAANDGDRKTTRSASRPHRYASKRARNRTHRGKIAMAGKHRRIHGHRYRAAAAVGKRHQAHSVSAAAANRKAERSTRIAMNGKTSSARRRPVQQD